MKKYVVLIISDDPIAITPPNKHGIECFVNEEVIANLGESDSWKVQKLVPQYFPDSSPAGADISGKGDTAKIAVVDWLKNLVCAFKFDAHPKPQ